MATNPQARADAIYNQLFNHYYTAAGLNWNEYTTGRLGRQCAELVAGRQQ